MYSVRIIKRFLNFSINAAGVSNNKKVKQILRQLLLLLVALTITALDPLGLGAATSKTSKDVFYRVISPFHPTGARQQVSVVFVDDVTIESGAMTWPVQFDEIEDFLLLLENYGPKAVFFDFIYLDDRNTPDKLNRLADTINDIRADSGISIYVGSPQLGAPHKTRAPSASRTCIETLAPIKNSVSRELLVTFKGVGDNYLLYGYNECSGELMISPALQTYADLCRGRACEINLQSATELGRFSQPLSYREGFATSPVNARLYPASFSPDNPAPCQSDTGSTWIDMKRSLSFLFHGIFAVFDQDDADFPCLYQPNLSVSYLNFLNDTDPELVQELVHDKVVMLGAALTGIQDHWNSAVHGLVPGVVAHATALENLLLWNDQYSRPAPLLIGNLRSSEFIEVSLLICLLLLQIVVFDKLKSSSRTRFKTAFIALGTVFNMLFIIGLCWLFWNWMEEANISHYWIPAVLLVFCLLEIGARIVFKVRRMQPKPIQLAAFYESSAIFGALAGIAFALCSLSIIASFYILSYAAINWLGVFMIGAAFSIYLLRDLVAEEEGG